MRFAWLFWPLVGFVLVLPGSAHADREACLAAHEQAQVARMHGRYVEAREQLIAGAQAGCPTGVRNDCKIWLEEVESSMPSLVLAVVDEGGHDVVEARVSSEAGLLSDRADGRALSLDPGVHRLRVEALGFAAHEQQLSVHEGEKRRLVRVVLRAVAAQQARAPVVAPGVAEPAQAKTGAKRPARLMLSGYILAGLGVVSLGTAAALGAVGKHKLDSLRARDCKPACPEGEVQAGKRKYVLANVAFGASATFLAAAVFTWLWGWQKRREAEPERATRHDRAWRQAFRPLSLAADRGTVSFVWDGRF